MTTVAGSKRTKPRSSPIAPTPQTLTHPAGRPGWVLALVLIAAAGLFAYAPSFDGVFALDDVRAIVRNETIRSLWPISVRFPRRAGRRLPAGRSPTCRWRSTTHSRPQRRRVALTRDGRAALACRNRLPSTPATCSSTCSPRRPCSAYSAGRCSRHVWRRLRGRGAMGRARRRARLGGASADNRGGHLHRPAGRVAHGALLPADALLLDSRVRRNPNGLVDRSRDRQLRTRDGDERGHGDGAGPGGRLVVAVRASRRQGRAAPCPDARPGLFLTWAVLAFLVAGERCGPRQRGLGDVVDVLLAQAEVIVHYARLAIIPSPLVLLYDWPLGTTLGAVAWQAALLAALVCRPRLAWRGAIRRASLAPGTSWSSRPLQAFSLSSRRSPPSIACTCRWLPSSRRW